MGGGGTLVDGFRRLFHRRTASGSNQSSNAGEEAASSDLEVADDPDLVALRSIRIRVPKRKMPLPVESHKKVRRCLVWSVLCFASFSFQFGGEMKVSGFLVILDSWPRGVLRQDQIFVAPELLAYCTISLFLFFYDLCKVQYSSSAGKACVFYPIFLLSMVACRAIVACKLPSDSSSWLLTCVIPVIYETIDLVKL